MVSTSCISTNTGPGPAKKDNAGSALYPRSTEVQDLIKAKDYLTALEILNQLWDKNKDERLLKEYRQLTEKIRNAGDREYEQGNFAQAGSIYTRLLESKIITENPTNHNSPVREHLKKQIRACTKRLTELGIIKYREQKLNEAIAIWQRVLEFDPQNSAIEKAIGTAGKQQYSLQQM